MPFEAFEKHWIVNVDQRLEELCFSNTEIPELLREAIRWAVLAPGKRIRPLLTLAVAESFNMNGKKVLDLACAMEMVHASSLILDDLPCMDDAVLRRGRETCHKRFGEDLAVLASFAVLNQAYAVLAEAVEHLPTETYRLRDYIRITTKAVGAEGMVGGQTLDLHPPEEITFDSLEYIHSHKTGALFVAAAVSGAMAAQARPKDVEKIQQFAKNLGLAFQIQDDLLDVLSSPEITGKRSMDMKRKTFVSLFGTTRCREAVSRLLQSARATLDRLPRDPELLKNLVEHVGTRTS